MTYPISRLADVRFDPFYRIRRTGSCAEQYMKGEQSMSAQTAVIDENTIAPDTGKPMPKTESWRFMIGFIIFGIMWMMSGTIGSNVLFPERFNGLNIGQPEAILATITPWDPSSPW